MKLAILPTLFVKNSNVSEACDGKYTAANFLRALRLMTASTRTHGHYDYMCIPRKKEPN